jgi:hypothetical protein
MFLAEGFGEASWMFYKAARIRGRSGKRPEAALNTIAISQQLSTG